MKYEWRKQEKAFYGVGGKPEIITLPAQQFITISGEGNPNEADFSDRVGVLYALAYPIKMRYKKGWAAAPKEKEAPEYEDYTVFPLEGLWNTADPENLLNKDQFSYTIMIKQPGFITSEQFEAAYDAVSVKKPNPLLKEVRFETLDEGECLQLLHRGSYDDEPASFEKMEAFIRERGYRRLGHCHREIYLSDPRKTAPEKRKTILRFQIEKED